MKQRPQSPSLTKAELRAQGDHAVSTAKAHYQAADQVRKCGRCGESSSVMVQAGQVPRRNSRASSVTPYKQPKSRRMPAKSHASERVRVQRCHRFDPMLRDRSPCRLAENRIEAIVNEPDHAYIALCSGFCLLLLPARLACSLRQR